MTRILILCFALQLFSFAHTKTEVVNDGPYLFYKSNSIEQVDIIKNQKVTSTYQGSYIIPNSFQIDESNRYENVSKIVAISDVHGKFDLFKTLLINNKVIDQQLNWSFDDGHLVITGDIFDRGDTVTEALWLIFNLEQQAAKAGGKIHYLLGNHEYMVLRDDQRYLHPKYLHTVSHFNHDLRAQYSENSVLGRWLRSKPTIIIINGFMFLHGGIHQDFLDLALSIEQANDEFRKTIGKSKDELKKNQIWRTLHSSNGPIWYRGFFRDETLTQKDINAILNALNVKRIIVGHTSMPTIESHHQGKIIAIDSSIKRGETGELLFWQDHKFTRGLLDGNRKNLNESFK